MAMYRTISGDEFQQRADDEQHAGQRARLEETDPGEKAVFVSSPMGAGDAC